MIDLFPIDQPSPKNHPTNELTEEILQLITTAMSESAEIDVTTYIDSWDLDSDSRSPSASHLQTKINLLDKTVAREIDRKLIDNPAYGELQRWHIEQVRLRQESLVDRFTSLSKLRQIIRNCI
ncbi:MAG: hypothetical protein AAFQ41_02125 [Cyanobacteria bacterium J06623_7]